MILDKFLKFVSRGRFGFGQYPNLKQKFDEIKKRTFVTDISYFIKLKNPCVDTSSTLFGGEEELGDEYEEEEEDSDQNAFGNPFHFLFGNAYQASLDNGNDSYSSSEESENVPWNFPFEQIYNEEEEDGNDFAPNDDPSNPRYDPFDDYEEEEDNETIRLDDPNCFQFIVDESSESLSSDE